MLHVKKTCYHGDYQGDGYHGDGYHGDGYHGDGYQEPMCGSRQSYETSSVRFGIGTNPW